MPNNISVWAIIDNTVKQYSHLPDFKVLSVTIIKVMMFNSFQFMGIEIAKAPATPQAPVASYDYICRARNVPLTLSPNDSINITKSYMFLGNVSSYIEYQVKMSWSVSEQRTETTTTPI